MGSGQTKITIAKVEEQAGMPTEVLFAEETAVLVGHDFKKNKNGLLSDKILFELEQVLIHYRTLALEYGTNECAGIATAVFRESKNGAEFIKKVREEIGIDLQLISQVEEGRVGFLTAVTASGQEASEIIAWDSGGASFQITTEVEGKLVVYEGAWGSSKVLAAMVEKVQGKDFSKVQSANPATLEDVRGLHKIVIISLSPPHHELKTKLSLSSYPVVAIGGPYSAFKIASLAIGDVNFTKEQVLDAITDLVDCTDSELEDFPEPEMVIPRLTLVYTVMDHFNIPIVNYRETTGSTLGIFISPQFWAGVRRL